MAAAMTLGALAAHAETTPEAYLGGWTGEWRGIEATTEIPIERIDGADVYETYCHRRGWHSVYDRHPDGPTPGRLTADGVVFKQTASPRTIRWKFTPTADDQLRFAYRNRHGETHRLTLERDEGP